MLMGTHTSDNDNNYVQIATVHLPKPQSELNLEKYDDERGGKFVLLSIQRADSLADSTSIMSQKLELT